MRNKANPEYTKNVQETPLGTEQRNVHLALTHTQKNVLRTQKKLSIVFAFIFLAYTFTNFLSLLIDRIFVPLYLFAINLCWLS